MKFPAYYGPFFLDEMDWSEKSQLMASFSSRQVAVIDQYLSTIRWHYHSEESLVTLLEEVKIQLINVALPTIAYVKDQELLALNSFNLSRELQAKSKQLYLQLLDAACRFPA